MSFHWRLEWDNDDDDDDEDKSDRDSDNSIYNLFLLLTELSNHDGLLAK